MEPGTTAAAGTEKSATRDFPEIANVIRTLRPGDRLRISRTMRINTNHSWPTTVEGKFVQTNHLRTGLATDRNPEDDIVVMCLHIIKDNGERASVTLDEYTLVQKL